MVLSIVVAKDKSNTFHHNKRPSGHNARYDAFNQDFWELTFTFTNYMVAYFRANNVNMLSGSEIVSVLGILKLY